MSRMCGARLARRRRRFPLAPPLLLAACAGMPGADYFSMGRAAAAPARAAERGRRRPGQGRADPAAVGAGQCRPAAQSMRNAAEMALAEFNNPDIQLLVKDDGGSGGGRAAGRAAGARRRRRDHSRTAVRPIGQRRRPGRAPARRAGDRVLDRRQRRGARRLFAEFPARVRCGSRDRLRHRSRASAPSRRSFPTMPMAPWSQAAFQQAVARGGGRVVAMERYPLDRTPMQGPVQRVAQAAQQADTIFIPDGADSVSRRCRCSRPAASTSAHPADRHRAVGRPAHLRRTGRAGRLVRGAGCRPASGLSRAAIAQRYGAGPGAARDARL